MSGASLVECSFFVPVVRDALLSDGGPHELEAWEWLETEMFVRFGGLSESPGLFSGFYRDPDTGEKVKDKSRQFTVAVTESQVHDLRDCLRGACDQFHQKCIYLSAAARVEFVWKRDHEPNS